MTTAWSGSDKSANVTVSGSGNRTATITDNATSFVRSTDSHASGKVMFEMVYSAAGPFDVAGIANAAYDVSENIPGFDASGRSVAAVGTDSTNRIANTSIGTVTSGGIAAGDTIAYAIDITNKLYWARMWRTGAWQDGWNSNSGNPTAGTGGYDLSTLAAGPYFLVCGTVVGSGDAFTMNAASADFVTTMASDITGFTAWDVPGVSNTLMPQICL